MQWMCSRQASAPRGKAQRSSCRAPAPAYLSSLSVLMFWIMGKGIGIATGMPAGCAAWPAGRAGCCCCIVDACIRGVGVCAFLPAGLGSSENA